MKPLFLPLKCRSESQEIGWKERPVMATNTVFYLPRRKCFPTVCQTSWHPIRRTGIVWVSHSSSSAMSLEYANSLLPQGRAVCENVLMLTSMQWCASVVHVTSSSVSCCQKEVAWKMPQLSLIRLFGAHKREKSRRGGEISLKLG